MLLAQDKFWKCKTSGSNGAISTLNRGAKKDNLMYALQTTGRSRAMAVLNPHPPAPSRLFPVLLMPCGAARMSWK